MLSVVGLGNDKNAIETMKSLAESGKGNLIKISETIPNTEALIEEIRKMSKIEE